jgi:hypothetical protein
MFIFCYILLDFSINFIVNFLNASMLLLKIPFSLIDFILKNSAILSVVVFFSFFFEFLILVGCLFCYEMQSIHTFCHSLVILDFSMNFGRNLSSWQNFLQFFKNYDVMVLLGLGIFGSKSSDAQPFSIVPQF